MQDDRISFSGLTVLITIEAGIDKKPVEKLSDRKMKAVSDMKSAKVEAHWLKKMEESSLKDYKSKDISSNRFVPQYSCLCAIFSSQGLHSQAS